MISMHPNLVQALKEAIVSFKEKFAEQITDGSIKEVNIGPGPLSKVRYGIEVTIMPAKAAAIHMPNEFMDWPIHIVRPPLARAGVMLIVNQGLILAISRRNNKNIFGLPGGKCEPNENQKQASIRETEEETSVIVHDCVEIYSRVEPASSPDGFDFESATFFATSWEGIPQNSEEGEVVWLTAEELTTTKGAFPKYNRDMIDQFKKMFPNVTIKGE